MIRRTFLSTAAALLLAGPAGAQPALSLTEAVARARRESLTVRLAEQGEEAARARMAEARAGYLPRVDVVEGWQRGNQPVYVFGSLLAQRRFTEADFAVEALNHPSPLDNHRAAITVQQLIWDGGAREASLATAALGRRAAQAERDRVGQDVAITTTRAYGAVLSSQAAARAAQAALEAAESDVVRARDRRDAGLVTQADVLAIEVHAARMHERQIQATADAHVARLRLNEAIGAPLDARFTLQAGAAPPEPSGDEAGLADRPDLRRARLDEQVAAAAVRAARAAFLPQVGVSGGWEWNGSAFDQRVPAWLVGAEVRWTIFRGGADRARATAAAVEKRRAALERERKEIAARVDVEAARARLTAARAREAVSRATVAQARESERIIRDRYENGLAEVTSLLRAAEAVVASEAQAVAARVDVLVGSAELQRALGQ